MTAFLTPLLLWWESRAPRERLLLVILMGVLGVWLIYCRRLATPADRPAASG